MRKRLKLKRLHWLLLFFVIAGLLLRLNDLGAQSFWIDEVYSSLAAKSIMENGMPVMPSGHLYSRAILHTFIVALSMMVFGLNEFAARLPSVFFGVLCVPITYFLVKEFFDEKIALLTAFFVSFSSLEIAFSRQARMYQQLQFFYLLSLFLFFRFDKKPSRKNLGLVVVSTTITILSHSLGFALLVIYPVYFVARQWREAKKLVDVKLEDGFLNYLVLFLFVLIAVVLGQWHFKAVTRILSTQVNYLEHYIGYLVTYFPVISYLAPIGALIAFKEKRGELLALLAVIVPFYFIVFHQILVGFRYLFLFFPLFFAFASVALLRVSSLLVEPLKTKSVFLEKIKVLIPILIFLSVLSTTPFLTTRAKTHYYLSPSEPQPDFKSVYGQLKTMVSEEDALIVSYPEVALWHGLEPDYWMAFSISGFPVERWIRENNYKRTLTPVIKNVTGLEKAYKKHARGFIVLDNMAGNRIDKNRWKFIENETEWLSNFSRPGRAGSINVYVWSNQEN